LTAGGSAATRLQLAQHQLTHCAPSSTGPAVVFNVCIRPPILFCACVRMGWVCVARSRRPGKRRAHRHRSPWLPLQSMGAAPL